MFEAIYTHPCRMPTSATEVLQKCSFRTARMAFAKSQTILNRDGST